MALPRRTSRLAQNARGWANWLAGSVFAPVRARRLTTAQRDAVEQWDDQARIFNMTTDRWEVYDQAGDQWIDEREGTVSP